MGARASQFFCDRERIILTVFALEEMKSEGSQRPVPLGDPAPPRGRISRRLSCHAWTCLLGSGSRNPCVSCRASRHCRRAGVRFGTEPAAPPSPGGVRESMSMAKRWILHSLPYCPRRLQTRKPSACRRARPVGPGSVCTQRGRPEGEHGARASTSVFIFGRQQISMNEVYVVKKLFLSYLKSLA